MGRHSGKHRAPGGWRGPPASLLLSLGAAIGVVVIVVCAVALANRGSQPTAQKPPKVSAGPQPSLLLDRSPSPSPTTSLTAAPSPRPTARRPTVQLRWTGGKSWVRVTDAGKKVLLVGVQPQFTVKTFTGRSFFIEIGYAGNVTVIIHGGKPHLAGRRGQIVRFTVTGP